MAGVEFRVGIEEFKKMDPEQDFVFLTHPSSVLAITAYLTGQLAICKNPVNFFTLVIHLSDRINTELKS